MRWLLIVLHGLIGVSAIAAGQELARNPDGSGIGLESNWLDGSPFPDFRVPGLFLAIVIGGANLVSAWLLWRRHPLGPVISMATGWLLIAWIGIQTIIIGPVHWSQAMWWAIFALMALLGTRLAYRATYGR